ncbi:MAG: glycosyltransferase family 4 protein [Phycisphaerales bacterium]|nr:MAG: glycosyltransferase family 4 protein [Phycisphaerales bacterium]
MNKRIAIITERANIALGGAERSVFELAAALSGLGCKVDVLAATGQGSSRNVHVFRPDKRGGRIGYSAFARVLRNHLSKNKYDIIHSVLPFEFADVYQPRGGTYAESILRHAASHGNTFIESYKRLTAFGNLRRAAFLRAERRLARAADGPVIAALSQYVADQFQRHYGADAKRIVVIPNGVKTDRQINTDQADRLRSQILAEARLREADHPVLFLFVANNFRLKGLAPLIRAVSAAARPETERKCCLVVVGRDKTRKYRRLARQLDLRAAGQAIVFLGSVSHIQCALSVANVAVLPTFYDPASRFILEALAAGKPVITTKFNGAADLFVDNRHGKVIDTPENINALAEAIRTFTDTHNIEKASKAIAEDSLKDHITISRAARELMGLYESILQRKGQT